MQIYSGGGWINTTHYMSTYNCKRIEFLAVHICMGFVYSMTRRKNEEQLFYGCRAILWWRLLNQRRATRVCGASERRVHDIGTIIMHFNIEEKQTQWEVS